MDISGRRHDASPNESTPLGELLGDAAGHAQGVIRTEMRLAIAQVRQEVSVAARRVTLLGGVIAFGLPGLVGLLIAGAMALATVMTAWLAVLVVAAASMFVALALLLAGRTSR